MHSSPECSMIVAAYNEEKNIEKCLLKLLQQTFKNFEIIVVDDGSKDQTANIIKHLATIDHRIKYFYQDNQGAAKARETGIKYSLSDFIAFVDADDYIDDNTVGACLRAFENNELVDIVLFDLIYIKDNLQENFEYYTSEKLIDGLDAFENSILRWGVHGFGVFKKSLFLKSIDEYNNYNLNNNYVNNDEVITRLNLRNSRHIYLSDAKYYYVYNENSVTRSINTKYCKILFNSMILNDICKDDDVKMKALNLLATDLQGIYRRFKKWNVLLDNKKEWQFAMRQGISYLAKNGFSQLSLRNKIRFIRLYLKLALGLI